MFNHTSEEATRAYVMYACAQENQIEVNKVTKIYKVKIKIKHTNENRE